MVVPGSDGLLFGTPPSILPGGFVWGVYDVRQLRLQA